MSSWDISNDCPEGDSIAFMGCSLSCIFESNVNCSYRRYMHEEIRVGLMNDIQMRRQTYIGIFLSPCFSFVFHMPGGFFLIMLTIDVKNVSYQFQNRVVY